MAIIKSFSPFLNLSNFQVFENDVEPNSEYFRISELSESLTGGKNGFLIEGSEHLKESTEIKVEILDVDGNPVYFEPGGGSPQYYEGNSKLVSVHVYDDTAIGLGKITILGELKTYRGESNALIDVPAEWKGVYNVKWERDIQINKNIQNETIVRFYQRPTVKIDELVKPIFTKVIPDVTQTGTLSGIPQSPPAGSDLSTWRAGTAYKLKIDDGVSNWTSSVDDNTISVSSLNYSPNVIEVLSNTEVLVDTPFTSSNGEVAGFLGQSYSSTFEFVEGQTITDSALTGSFAKINFNNLKTFVGDVARVKVFRKSRNTIGDFQFVQESKLESSELLKDVTTTADTELSYGRFDQSNLDNYWITSSNDHPVTINSDKLNASAKIDYDSSAGGTQILSTSSSFEITSGIEYTLNFKTLKSGSEGTSQSIRAYFSGSNYEQNFLTISGSAIYNTRQSVSQNILANSTANDTHLKFDITGGDWYISNISLKNAQDTSFSPDEFTLIQDIPRKLAIETFDFKFEFYDINNNYIPVDVLSTKAFTGGNDFPSSDKLLTFESDRNAFRFSSGSIGNPPFQQIQFKTSTNNLTGSVTYASAAFDIDGAYITPASYTGTYPGTLTNVTPAGAIITIANFSGSDDSIRVGSIVYTSSIEELEEFETVYRLEDGDNAPQLIVTSNVNQFIYEPTTISPKPSGQSATIRAQRKNLFSLSTPIEVNSGSGAPPLSPPTTDVATGIDTYTISALEYSASFAGNPLLETTYSFTGSDQFNIDFSDEITISPVINFDAVSIVLSNESTSFPANSLGVVSSNFDASKGKVQMFVGGTEISHDDVGGGRLKNTFDITSIAQSNVTAISTSPTTSEYGISAFGNSHDSGSLTLNIDYLSGDSATSQSFQKVVSYTKSKKGVPNVEIAASPQSQTINSNSRGSGSVAPATITVKATEGGTDRFTSIGTLVFSGGISGSASTESIEFTQGASDMISDTETVTIPVNFTDSEGTSGTKNIIASFSRVKKGEPNVEVAVSPQSQALNANSLGTGSASPATITVKATEGGTDRFTSISTPTITGGLSGTVSTNTITFSDTVSDMESEIATVTIPINFTDGEGTTGTKTISATITRVKSVPPVVNISANPQAQSVASNADFSSVSAPSSVTIAVNEGGSNYTYTTSTVTANKYKITNVTNGTNNNNGTITPTTPTSGAGTTSVVTLSYTNSEGSAFTSKTITINVGVAAQGDDGADGPSGLSAVDGLNFDVSPASQNITRQQVPVSFGIPTLFTVNVVQGVTVFSYDDSSPYSSGSFYIDSVSNGTNNDDKTITPSTPTDLTAVNTSFDINYTDISGSTGTISKSHKVNVVVDGNTGPGIIHTGEWASGRNYLFSPSGTAGTARRDTVYIASSGEYYAATVQHTSTAGGVTGPPGSAGSNSWELLGTSDLFVAAKVGLFEDSFVQNTLNVGTNASSGFHASNITLAGGSANPYISLGQGSGGTVDQAYDKSGIFIGAVGGTPKLSLKNASGNRYLKWDGSDLEIAGNIQITSGPASASLAAVTTGSAANATAASNASASAAGAQSTADGINANTGSLINPTSYDFGPGGSNSTFDLSSAPGTPNGTGLYLGSTNLGYYKAGTGAGWKSYMDNSGNFYLGGTTGALQWNGTTLSIEGNITITGGQTATQLNQINAATGSNASAASNAATAASNAAGDAATAQQAADDAQNTADSKTDDTVANAASASAAAAQSTADGINANTGSLINPTSFTFNPNNLTNVSASPAGLHLGANQLGYSDGTSFKSFMDSSGNFYLGGTSGALTWTASTSVLNVNRVTATSGTIGSWAIASSQLEGGTVDGGSDGNNTTSGMIINSGGWISAPDFNISSAGVASFGTSAKIGGQAFSGVLEVDTTDGLRIRNNAKIGTFGSIGTKFTTYNGYGTSITGFQSDIDDLASFSQSNCVLPGTKIITKRGEINIEDTKQKDIIKVFNFETKEWGWSPINEILVNKSKGWCILKTESGKELKCSKSHSLYHPDFKNQSQPVGYLTKGDEVYVLIDNKLVLDKVKSIEKFDEEVEVWNYELKRIHNYISNEFLSHNALNLQKIQFTAGHQYVKLNNTSIGVGDLVKLDSNNELIKSTTSKDNEIVGILWKTIKSGSVNTDSFGNVLPENETDSKTIWRVASIGDSFESGSNTSLPGFKVCNQGGDVSKGDLLCSSDTEGYLMKQPSEWVVISFDGDNNPQYEERQSQCSYTVAKAMEDVTFDSEGKSEEVYGFLHCG